MQRPRFFASATLRLRMTTVNLGMMITVEEASRLYLESDAAHDFDHVLRVLALAERIGQAQGADL